MTSNRDFSMSSGKAGKERKNAEKREKHIWPVALTFLNFIGIIDDPKFRLTRWRVLAFKYLPA
jgi:hypothetical protein